MNALTFVLKGLIPYTRENFLLSHRPQQFFEELGNTGYTREAFHQARSRAVKAGLVDRHGDTYRLTFAGYQRFMKDHLADRAATVRDGHNDLVVSFDIPEAQRKERNFLRQALETLNFRQVHRSVWVGNAEFAEDLAAASRLLRLRNNVILIQARSIERL